MKQQNKKILGQERKSAVSYVVNVCLSYRSFFSMRSILDFLLHPSFVLSVFTLCCIALILLFSLQNENITASLTFLMITLVLFAAAIVNEVMTRRRWEENLSRHMRQLENSFSHMSEVQDQTIADNKKLHVAVSGLIQQLKEKSSASDQRNLSDILNHIQEQNPQAKINPSKTHSTTTQKIAQTSAQRKYALPYFDNDSHSEGAFSHDVMSELISTAVRHDRVDIFLQPIVRLPQRKVSFYEVYARLRAKKDSHLSASEYLDVARQEHLIPAIDNLLLMRAIQLIRRQKGTDNPSVAYFLNVNIDTLNNSALMADLVDFLSDNRHLASKIILEFAQRDFKTLNQSVLSVLKSLSQMGVRFSMDQVAQLDLDVMQLLSYNVVFVKIDASLFLDTISSKVGQRALINLKKDLDNFGIDVIVQKIETEQSLKEISSYDIDFGQGYLFGEPEQSQKHAA